VQANGYIWTIYGAKTAGGRANLGNSNLYNPKTFSNPHVTKGGGAYKNSQSSFFRLAKIKFISPNIIIVRFIFY